jgi:hypothetical protein
LIALDAALDRLKTVDPKAVEDKPPPYLVMEYVPEKTLQKRLDDLVKITDFGLGSVLYQMVSGS